MLRPTAALILMLLAACPEKKPLTNPSEIDACNLDSDCITDNTCECDRCVARNKTIHVQMCPRSCGASPCTGKQAACVSGHCEIVK